MRTAFVTGGAGYLGSHLAKALKQAGYYTYCFDLKTPENKKYWDHYTFGDVRNWDDLHASFSHLRLALDKTPDVVFHLAGLIEVGESVKNPIEFWETNVGGTCNLLSVMKAFYVNNIVYSSTAGLYRPQFTTLSEKDEVGSNNPYANSKYAAECAIRDSKLNYVVFRFFNLAGADPDGEMGEMHDPETHLIPLMFKSLNNEEFHIYGKDYNTPDGTCIRDYVHVSDVADAHILADEYLQNPYQNHPRTFNLGTGKGHTVLDVVKMSQNELDLPIKFSYKSRRDGDPSRLVANCDLAKRYLGFKPKHDLKSILKTAYDWHIHGKR